MPTHREKFILNAPPQIVNTAVYEYFRPTWNFLSQEPDRVVVEEKIQLGKRPYHPITFIGAAHIEVAIRSVSNSVEITCNAFNEYYGYDPPDPHDLSEGITTSSNGHTHAQMQIESHVKAFRRRLEQIVKLGLGEQQNPPANEQINPTKVAQQINRVVQSNLTIAKSQGLNMNIEGKTVWQIAAGNGDTTNYAELCLMQDVIIIGPGRFGAWPACEKPMLDNNWSSRKVATVRRFAEDISHGDIVVLRVATDKIYGVGEVVGRYGHSEIFSKVETWDLQHFRRVRWLWHKNGRPELFPTYSLNLGDTVQRLTKPKVRRWLEMLPIEKAAYDRPLQAL